MDSKNLSEKLLPEKKYEYLNHEMLLNMQHEMVKSQIDKVVQKHYVNLNNPNVNS